MRFSIAMARRVCVEISPGVYALGDLVHTTIDGDYVIHLDGECTEHRWSACDVEFLDSELN